MPEEQNPESDKEMERLSRAIVEAIVKSKDVRRAISDLSETEDIHSKSFMILMLKVANLAEAMGMETPSSLDEDSSDEARRPARKEVETCGGDYEDGKKLSEAEAAFREFLSSRFDENRWLRNNGLIF